MNPAIKNNDPWQRIFSIDYDQFEAIAIEAFQFQHQHNMVYRKYCDILKADPSRIHRLSQIPFLPIRFFKTHDISTTVFDAAAIFESSGTTETVSSKHRVKDLGMYEQSFGLTFKKFYGNIDEYCVLALLPSYLERSNSSLVYMAEQLIRSSGHPKSGFYLDDFQQFKETLLHLEQARQKTLLLGVSFALLDFVAEHPVQLRNTIIMETGGMKGRRQEITRSELHEILCKGFGVHQIHSEYGMTELLSQAYSQGNGIFNCPAWMKILIREEDDPFSIKDSPAGGSISGAVNIIDLANIYSCCFIATDDAGKLYANGSFEILGRLDNSDIRGCSLLAL